MIALLTGKIVERDFSSSATSASENEFERRYRICADRLHAYESAEAAAEEAAALTLRIEALEKKVERIRTHLADIKKAEELLGLAAEGYRKKRAASAHAFFEKHLYALGATDAASYRLGDRFAVTFLEGDAYHAAEALSRGGKDRAALARSLALLSAIPEAAGLPLLLDDPFLSYDDGRLATAIEALEALSKERQILYLTCSHSRMP